MLEIYMNIKQALTLGTQKLRHLENPKLEAEILLCSVMGPEWVRTLLKIKDDQVLNLHQQTIYRWRLLKRSRHIPSAYIIGQADWNDLDLALCSATLIPRDETETLCHHIKEQQINPPGSILDVGTGSGCIAIYLAQQWENAEILGLDISRRALQYARYNAKVNATNIVFKKSDLLGTIPPKTHFDLMVANLPYVPESLVVTPEVNKEPRGAIFSADNGLHHVKRLASQIKQKEITFNQLWLEFLPSQSEDIKNIFAAHHTEFFTDVGGNIYFACIKP